MANAAKPYHCSHVEVCKYILKAYLCTSWEASFTPRFEQPFWPVCYKHGTIMFGFCPMTDRYICLCSLPPSSLPLSHSLKSLHPPPPYLDSSLHPSLSHSLTSLLPPSLPPSLTPPSPPIPPSLPLTHSLKSLHPPPSSFHPHSIPPTSLSLTHFPPPPPPPPLPSSLSLPRSPSPSPFLSPCLSTFPPPPPPPSFPSLHPSHLSLTHSLPPPPPPSYSERRPPGRRPSLPCPQRLTTRGR